MQGPRRFTGGDWSGPTNSATNAVHCRVSMSCGASIRSNRPVGITPTRSATCDLPGGTGLPVRGNVVVHPCPVLIVVPTGNTGVQVPGLQGHAPAGFAPRVHPRVLIRGGTRKDARRGVSDGHRVGPSAVHPPGGMVRGRRRGHALRSGRCSTASRTAIEQTRRSTPADGGIHPAVVGAPVSFSPRKSCCSDDDGRSARPGPERSRGWVDR